MNKVVVVHFLGVDDVTVLFLAQVGGVDAIGAQEFSVGHAEGLTDGLCDELCLRRRGERLGTTTQYKGYPSRQQQGCEEDHSGLNEHRAKKKNVKTKNVYKENI